MRVWGLFGVVLLAGCDRPGPPGDSGRFAHSAIRRSIAPWDGPAIDLFLSEHPLTDPNQPGPHVLVAVYRLSDGASGRRITLPGKESRDGVAFLIDPHGKTTPLQRAEIEFGEIKDGQPATGTYDLVLPDGGRARGRFEAAWWPSLGRGG